MYIEGGGGRERERNHPHAFPSFRTTHPLGFVTKGKPTPPLWTECGVNHEDEH